MYAVCVCVCMRVGRLSLAAARIASIAERRTLAHEQSPASTLPVHPHPQHQAPSIPASNTSASTPAPAPSLLTRAQSIRPQHSENHAAPLSHAISSVEEVQDAGFL